MYGYYFAFAGHDLNNAKNKTGPQGPAL